MTQSKHMKRLSFSFTCRPSGGWTDEDTELFKKNIKKYSEKVTGKSYYKGGYWVLEKLNDQRHMHGVVYLKKGIDRSSYRSHWGSIFKKGWLARGPTVWGIAWKMGGLYNDDFLQNYLIGQKTMDPDSGELVPKGDPFEVIYDDLPPIEERLKTYKDIKTTFKWVDSRFDKLSKALLLWWGLDANRPSKFVPGPWTDGPETKSTGLRVRKRMRVIQSKLEISVLDVQRFLNWKMYKDRTMQCILDKRKFNQTKNCLFNFLTEGKYADGVVYPTNYYKI